MPNGKSTAAATSTLLRAVLGVAGFAVLVVGLVFILGFVTRPYWAGFVRVPALVTSQHPYYSRGDHCDLGLEFTTVAGTTPPRSKRLSTTVLHRNVYKNTTELSLQAPGRDGTPQIFQLTYAGRGPWPNLPTAGHVMDLWILAGGGRHVLFSGPDCQNPAAGRAHVPNGFELRTMGI